MIIRNIGTKIINIGSVVLMPDDEHVFSAFEADTPAIHKLEEMGFLKVDKEPAKKEKAAEKVEAPAVETVSAEQSAEPEQPKTGRRSKKAAEE